MKNTEHKRTAVGELNVEHCTDPVVWDSFVKQHDGPPYALWGWGVAVEAYGHDRWNLVVRHGDEIVGALPITHIKSRLFGSKLVSPPYGERGSVLVTEYKPAAVARKLLEYVSKLATELGVDFVSLRGSSIGSHPDFETKNRFVTFQIPTNIETDSIWNNIKESRRRQIRQAEENPELTYDTGSSLADLKSYYELNLRSVRGHGTPPHSFEFYLTLWEQFADTDQLKLELVWKDGQLINGILNISNGSTVHQWGVITDYEYRDLNGGSYLLWKSLERAAVDGYHMYELGRTREGSGVYMFKKSFGGEKTWYNDRHYFPAKSAELPHPEDETYEPLKRVWRKLPIRVTELIGPSLRNKISL